MLNFLLSLSLALNMQGKMENNSQITAEETKEIKGIEQSVQNPDSMNISSHNHFHFDRDYSPGDIFDFMIEKEIDIATMEGYEMPDIISDPFLKIVDLIEKDSLAKEKYDIGFADSLVVKVTNKEKDKSIYIINSREVATKENAHVQYFGYCGKTNYGKPLEQAIETGLEAGAIVSICHPFTCEEKIFAKALNPWSKEYLIGEERIRLLEKVAEKYQGEVCFEEFNAFLGQVLWVDIKDASEKCKDFLDNMEGQGINLTRIYGNDSHVKSKKLIEDMAKVYIKMPRNEIDTLNGYSMKESIKKNLYEGKYSLTEKQHTPGWHILLGFGPDKAKAIINEFLNKFKRKQKRLGEQ